VAGNPLYTEIRRLLVILTLCFMAGLLIDALASLLLTGLIGFLVWHVYQLILYTNWLHNGKQLDVPDVDGLWGEVYYRIVRLRSRNRKSKQRLARYLSRFRDLTAALPDAVVVLTEDTTIEWFNDAAKELLKLRRSIDVGQRIDNLIRHPFFIKYLEQGDYAEPLQLQSPLHDERILLIYVIPYGSAQRLLVIRDITRLNRLEQMRKDFVANVSHELGTPLTVISGYIEVLTNDADSPPDARHEALLQMQQQTLRMQNIVNDLLLLSRLDMAEQHATRVEVAVPALLADLHEQLRGLADERQQLDLDIQEDLLLRGDERELFSAFSNLVANAIKYTPAQGKITISWFAQGENAVFQVTDTGTGIPAQDIPRLTERFFRVDDGRSRAHGGTGLGLAIVKHVLTHHDARLEIDSQLGRGSSFRCVFPVERVVRRNQR